MMQDGCLWLQLVETFFTSSPQLLHMNLSDFARNVPLASANDGYTGFLLTETFSAFCSKASTCEVTLLIKIVSLGSEVVLLLFVQK
jgi:hypothetical protein